MSGKAKTDRGGRHHLPLDERNKASNLILLCKECHRKIDTLVNTYPVERLRGFKEDHEERIEKATGQATQPRLDPSLKYQTERLYSTLLPVLRMPRYVYSAPASKRSEEEIKHSIQRPTDAGMLYPFILRGDRQSGLGGMRFRWVLLPDTMESHYYQEGYLLPQVQTQAPAFTDPPANAPALPLRPPLELYQVDSQSAGAPFQLPENLPALVDAYKRLSAEERERFLRSCYWLQQGTCTFLQSFSLAFIAAVSAVEALLDLRGRSLRQSFADFLARYVRLTRLTDRGHVHRPAFEKRLKVLYDRRSMITHGAGVISLDRGRWALDTIGQQEESDLRTLLRILPLALQNWLLEAAKSSI